MFINKLKSHSTVIYKITFLMLLGMFFWNQQARAQVAESSELFKTLAKQDSLLFNEGFNQCDIQITESLVSKDFEFYHDVNGVQNRKEFLKAIKENICSNPYRKPIRRLQGETLKLFPLENNGQLYGAIQEGTHQFYIKELDKDLYLTSTATFTHLWILKEGNWKLKTVLSYNHQASN